jgi:antitoxin HicB
MTNKDLAYYLSLPYTIIIEPDKENGGYVAWIKELRGCITQGETWDEIGMMIEDAKRGWLEVALEHGDTIPEPMRETLPV